MMNRRDVLTSSVFLAGGLAVSGIPQKTFGEEMPPPPPLPTKFNANILNAHCTTTRTVVTAFNGGGGATAAELTAAATAFATFVSEMNSTGYAAQIQAALTSQAGAITALDPATINVSALLAQAQKIGPATYAQMQFAVQQINSSSQSAALASNAIATAYSTYVTSMQQLAALAQQSGGILNVSTSRSWEKPRLLEAYWKVSTGMLVTGGVFVIAGLLVAALFPEGLLLGAFLGASIDVGTTLQIAGTMMGIDGAVEAGDGD